jgi:predicted RNase H-like HicB family nuclease
MTGLIESCPGFRSWTLHAGFARVRARTARFKRKQMHYLIETEQETDDRWIAEIPELPGAMVYGETEAEARDKVRALALRALADRIEHGEAVPDEFHISFSFARHAGNDASIGKTV